MLIRGRVGTAPIAPPRPVVIYHGECGFCRRWADRLRKLDRRQALVLLPLQAPDAVRISGCSRAALERAVHLVGVDGAVFAGAAAVREACRCLPAGWIVRILLGVPGVMAVAERAYAWVAGRWGPVGRRTIDGVRLDLSQNPQRTRCS